MYKRQELWSPQPADVRKKFSADLADALRQEYKTDSSGRSYRVNHAVRSTVGGKQSSFWADIDSAPPEHMAKAFQQRRRHIVGENYQLRLDVDHFNEIDPEREPFQLILDYEDDIEEMLIANNIKGGEAA